MAHTPVSSKFRHLALIIPLFVFVFSCSQPTSGQTQYGDVALRVASILETEHYHREPFDDAMSAKVLDTYLEMLDFRRVYFTKQDIDRFNEKYRTAIDDQLKAEGIPAASDIFGVLLERVRTRVDYAKEILENEEFTFDSDRTVRITRKEAPWPDSAEEEKQIWYNLIEEELLRDYLTGEALKKKALAEGKTPEERKDPKEKILKRYQSYLEDLQENDAEDVATLFIKAIARAYDPHSEYYSRKQYENFKIGMNKKLHGIGAMLSLDEDDIPTVKGLVVGGPAAKQGELRNQDKIVGVGQGDGEIVDVIGKKLGDTVDLIRGDIGSTVTLKVNPANAVDPAETKLIRIVRDQVDLKDSLATADLIETRDQEGNKQKIGWLRLSSFYSDMDGGETSTTSDVRRLLTRLQIEGMNGLVIDLRDNGGGSLEEAVNMTGLFIRKGPVVQAQNWRAQRSQKNSRNANPVYSGPMIVLTNRASASASEIFAAALQDYNRAVIIGEKSTFGKGTVQQLRPVFGRKFNFFNRADNEQKGALKLTIQTFYRINGSSTQLEGVVPDLQLPSIYDVEDFGEASLRNPLEVDPIQPANYKLWSNQSLPVDTLKQAMEGRIANDQEFSYIMEDIAEEKMRLKKNQISLNKAERKSEIENNEKENEMRKQERIERYRKMREDEKGLFAVYTITQDNFADRELVKKSEISSEALSGMSQSKEEVDEEQKLLEYPHLLDPYERETIRVMQDFIAIRETGKPVQMSSVAPPTRRADPVPITVQ